MKSAYEKQSEQADSKQKREEKVLQLLNSTVTVCESLHKQLLKNKNLFTETVQNDQDDVDPKKLIHFLQYTMWMYVKFKYGVYPANDGSLSQHFGSTDRIPVKQLNELDWFHLTKENIWALITELTQDNCDSLECERYICVRQCWNYFQYTVKERMKEIKLTGKVSKI